MAACMSLTTTTSVRSEGSMYQRLFKHSLAIALLTLSLLAMNLSFYGAISVAPLGIARSPKTMLAP